MATASERVTTVGKSTVFVQQENGKVSLGVDDGVEGLSVILAPSQLINVTTDLLYALEEAQRVEAV